MKYNPLLLLICLRPVMTNFPYREITVLSAVSSYAIAVYWSSDYIEFDYITTFSLTWIFCFINWAIWKVILYPKFFSPLRHFPSPKGASWWNGHYSAIAANPTGYPMIEWVNTVPNQGIIRYLGIFNSERLLITSPNALKEVLTTKSYDFKKPSRIFRALSRLLGVGLILAEGDEHKRQRKNLMPAFSFRHIKNLYPLFWKKSIEVTEAMTAEVRAGGLKYDELPEFQKEVTPRPSSSDSDTVIEVSDWASRATLDIIGIASFGRDFNAIRDPNTSLNKTYRKVFKPSRQAQILGLLNLFFPGWIVAKIPISRNGEIEAAAAVIRDTCRSMIRLKKEKLQSKQLNDPDILSIALENGDFTEENLIDQMMTFLAAGHETTSNALTWAVYLLSLHPSCQTRLRAEIRANLPKLNPIELIGSSQIDNLRYLNAVCNEVLRYYPPVSLTMRVAAHETTILGHRVPKDVTIIVSPWAVNRSKELWGPDVNTFNPERWLPSDTNPHPADGGATSNYSFLTFIHGPRSCIGQKFSKGELACLLAAWVGRFEFELNDKREIKEENLQIMGGLTVKPGKGLFMKTKIVDGW
ncbi:Cytochrome P450 monooxygenase FUM15 [Golovinomyces cichoracearum]|uniref:Cytochrome P450 monooxygenase FUM15 n=1 Tax=Golovinomyces cichoracearum TaxID=62708 RepID=A0A420HDJ4_9PEZI|nr:Cytochrome P450 monooxygenase FUM15 [Golovinomyces cichoracearum]